MQVILLFLCLCSGACFLWFALACEKYVTNATWSLFVSSIFGGLFINGTIPLFYESVFIHD